MNVTREFKADFDLVHESFCTPADEIEQEKRRLSAAGAVTHDARAYYAATAALIRAGWNPRAHPHVQTWREQRERAA